MERHALPESLTSLIDGAPSPSASANDNRRRVVGPPAWLDITCKVFIVLSAIFVVALVVTL